MNSPELPPPVVDFASGGVLGVLTGLFLRFTGCLGRLLLQMAMLLVAAAVAFVLTVYGFEEFTDIIEKILIAVLVKPAASLGFLTGFIVTYAFGK